MVLNLHLSGKRHTSKTLKLQSEIKKGSNNPRYGIEVTEETKKRLSESKKGKACKEETKFKISETLKNLPTKQCPYCLNYYKPAAYGKSHGEKCKKKS